MLVPVFPLKVRTLNKPNPLKATYTVIHMFVVLLLASVPSFILNLPVGIVARYVLAMLHGFILQPFR